MVYESKAAEYRIPADRTAEFLERLESAIMAQSQGHSANIYFNYGPAQWERFRTRSEITGALREKIPITGVVWSVGQREKRRLLRPWQRYAVQEDVEYGKLHIDGDGTRVVIAASPGLLMDPSALERLAQEFGAKS